jgi:NitT/TauT family transport system substrate-binding protein
MKYGYSPFLGLGGMFIAVERGYFTEQGIELEMVPFDSGGLMIPALSTSQIDASMGVPGPALFNALAREVNLKALLAHSYTGAFLMVRKDLVDSGALRSVEDLRGKRVSFHVEGSASDFVLRKVFYLHGLSLTDVEVERLTNPDIVPALANRAVDAAIAPEPVPVALESQGIAVRSFQVPDVIGLHVASLALAGPGLLNRDDAVITRFITAVVKGQREFDASIQGQRVVDPATRDTLNNWTKISAETIARAVVNPGPPNGRIDLDNVRAQQEFWLTEGLQRERIDLTKFVEPKYVDAALVQLR